MYTVVKAIKINDDGTVLVGCSTEACQGCKAEMFCNNKNDNTFTVKNSKKLELKEGDMVEIFLPPRKTIFSTLLVFALPLCLFPVGYLCAKQFLNLNEVLNAVCGFGTMTLAFVIASVISIKHKDALMPSISSII